MIAFSGVMTMGNNPCHCQCSRCMNACHCCGEHCNHMEFNSTSSDDCNSPDPEAKDEPKPKKKPKPNHFKKNKKPWEL